MKVWYLWVKASSCINDLSTCARRWYWLKSLLNFGQLLLVTDPQYSITINSFHNFNLRIPKWIVLWLIVFKDQSAFQYKSMEVIYLQSAQWQGAIIDNVLMQVASVSATTSIQHWARRLKIMLHKNNSREPNIYKYRIVIEQWSQHYVELQSHSTLVV